jgi:hypothetical protein
MPRVTTGNLVLMIRSFKERGKPNGVKLCHLTLYRKDLGGTKVDIDHVLAVPTARDGSLSTAGFDRSEWEIMYPLFVAEGLIDTFAHVSRRET